MVTRALNARWRSLELVSAEFRRFEELLLQSSLKGWLVHQSDAQGSVVGYSVIPGANGEIFDTWEV